MEKNNSILEYFIRKFLLEIEQEQEKQELKKKLLKIQTWVNKRAEKKLSNVRKYLDSVKKNMHNITKIEDHPFTLTSRLLVDTSSPMGWLIDEIGTVWDPILDVPFIPSASLKGVLRGICEWNYGSDTAEVIFGSAQKPKHKGNVTLLDAYPVSVNPSRGLLDVDAITPTYSLKSSNGTTIQEHKVQPVPVYFLTVAKGVTFNFTVVYNTNPENPLSDWQEEIKELPKDSATLLEKSIKEITRQLFKEGLEVWGIGAKTSSGYGIFKEVES